MLGRVDTSFQTTQRDMFESGLVAEIGVNAFAVWSAIKAHANYQKGVCWPSVRRLMGLTGLASATVQKALFALEGFKLLRRSKSGRRVLYVARERLDIRLGTVVLCTIVVDYVPARMRGQIERVQKALESGEVDAGAFADVEIIPGPGFVWDANAEVLRSRVSAVDVPGGFGEDRLPVVLAEKVAALRLASRRRG